MSCKTILLPSLLSAPFDRLGESVQNMKSAGASVFHFDVMDGHFVPNITIGPLVLDSLKNIPDCAFDVHLMVTNPSRQIKWFDRENVRSLSIHIETSSDIKQDLQWIRDSGKRSGVALNPPTTVEKVHPLLPYVDQILVMSVYPGFPGQTFLNESLAKIEALAELREREGLSYLIQVDGGINEETMRWVNNAGADEIVSGNTIFSDPNPANAFQRLSGLLKEWSLAAKAHSA
ncbi:MAG: ribulose-phosphate 3-epimerase [Candidatus Hinthialibacter antarcticus]|nr:ribulose-phosphate 3-epimerase [Candidatus Hinthialibacter antarcticus]